MRFTFIGLFDSPEGSEMTILNIIIILSVLRNLNSSSLAGMSEK